MALVIRQATDRDAERIHEIHVAAVRELCGKAYEPQVIDGWLRGRSAAGYARGIGKGATFVAEVGDVEVGFCEAIPGEILAVYVEPAWTGQGIGAALLSNAWKRAAATGGVVRLESTLNAATFYEHFGFRVVGRSAVRRNDVDVPVVVMEKQAHIQLDPTRQTQMDLHLRPALEADHPFLHDLNRAAYEALALRVFGTWDERLKRERLAAKLVQNGFRIIMLADAPVGALWSTESDDHVFLHDLMILPKHQRCGLGSRVLLLELGHARAIGKPLRLHTSRLNEAERFYRRHGFRETSRDADFIDFEHAG